jgi:hypothetical protein
MRRRRPINVGRERERVRARERARDSTHLDAAETADQRRQTLDAVRVEIHL